MNARKILLLVLVFAVGLATGCTSNEEKQPQAPANAPKLKQKAPGGAGPAGGPAPKGV